MKDKKKKNMEQGNLVPYGKQEIEKYSSKLISRGVELINTLEQEQTVELFPVRMQGLWGFIDKTGKMVIRPQFEQALMVILMKA